MLIPEVGDEVLVAFEREDLRFPYVLGALWNGKDKPPSPTTTARTTSGCSSRARSTTCSSTTASKGVVELAHEKGRKIVLDDDGFAVQDEKGNVVKIDSNSGAMTIEAKGQLTHQGARRSRSRRPARSSVKASGDAHDSAARGEHQLRHDDGTARRTRRRHDQPRHAARARARVPDRADRRPAGVARDGRTPTSARCPTGRSRTSAASSRSAA